MSTKTRNTLFRRKNRDTASADEPTPSSSYPAQTEAPAKYADSAPATTSTAAPVNGGSHYRGADAINADAAGHIGDLRKNTSDGIHGDLEKDKSGVSPGINGLMNPSEKRQGFEHPGQGSHFLEPSVDHLHNDFLNKWKKDVLLPNVQRWADLYLVEYIQNLLHTRTESIIQKYENAIAVIEEKHKQEIIELERAHKELLVTVVRKTWADYERKMENARIVKQVHFGFHPSTQKEAWGEDIHDVVPEVMEHVPSVYEPNVALEEAPNGENMTKHPSHHGGHRHHKHGQSTSTVPDGNDPTGIYSIRSLIEN